jgi:hypothetical protein
MVWSNAAVRFDFPSTGNRLFLGGRMLSSTEERSDHCEKSTAGSATHNGPPVCGHGEIPR